MEVVASTPGITWEAASSAAQAAVRYAQAKGWRINVGVVDRGGNLMAFLRMPGAFLHSIDIAIDKAYTAASFGFPTKAALPSAITTKGKHFSPSATKQKLPPSKKPYNRR
jgi:uncharacterized protein GlcG (DUF336 family)